MRVTIKNHRTQVDGRAADYVPASYGGGAFARVPKILIMHFTYGGTAASTAQWFRDPSNPGSSAHVVIERDGTIIQCVPFDRVAWHAGKSRLRDMVGMNQYSLGIELANWGYLQRTADGWQTYTQKKIAEPVLAVHPYGNPSGGAGPIGWESFPEAQVQSAAALARALVADYGVDEIFGHEDISRGRKWDPGPAFDLPRFRALVFGGRADDGDSEFEVTASEGLNLRAGPDLGAAILALLPAGTKVLALERSGQWMSVSVVGANGQPERTGWVHSNYVS